MKKRLRDQDGKKKDIISKKRSKVRNGKNWVLFVVAGVVLLLMVMGSIRIVQATNESGPLSKAQEQAREQLEIAQAQARHLKKPASSVPKKQAPPQRQAGIIDMHQGPFPSTQFTVRNFWQGPVGSNWELVYAGTKMNSNGSSGSGALVIYTEVINSDGGFDLNYLGTYSVPNGSSAVKIMAVNGGIMQLHSDTGSTFIFNLQTNQYS